MAGLTEKGSDIPTYGTGYTQYESCKLYKKGFINLLAQTKNLSLNKNSG